MPTRSVTSIGSASAIFNEPIATFAGGEVGVDAMTFALLAARRGPGVAIVDVVLDIGVTRRFDGVGNR